jgi:hypothetical protein
LVFAISHSFYSLLHPFYTVSQYNGGHNDLITLFIPAQIETIRSLDMKRLVIVGILALLLIGLLPSVFADPDNYHEFKSISLTCGAPYGTATVDRSYVFLDGSFVRATLEQISPSWGDFSLTNEMVVSAMSESGTLMYAVPPDGSLQITVELYNPDGSLASTSMFYAECPSGIAWVHSLAGIPGCMLPIPSTAVGGSFVQNAETYWKPGETVSPSVVIDAGNTAHVLGVDATGAYYKIIWGCQYLWVPVETMGPNFDDVWNGAPLPTEVVE